MIKSDLGVERRAFEVRLRMQPGITPRQELAFERDLGLYLLERELIGEGAPLAMSIRCDTRDLTVTDQVDLLAWLMASAPVAHAEVNSSAQDRADQEKGQGGSDAPSRVRASRSDLALAPVLELYRLGRIRSELVAQVLRA